MHAMRSGDHVLLKSLIEAGISTELFGDQTQRDPLQTAVKWGHIGIVQVLLDLDQSDLDVAALYDELPIICALMNGHLDIARLLISRGVDPNFAEGGDTFDAVAVGGTPICYASNEWPLEAVQFLVEEAGANLEFRGANGWTPLLFAVSNGFLGAVKLLLSAGANPKVKDNEGKNILFHAAQKNHKQIVSFLLQMPEHSDNLLDELDGISLAYIASEGKGQTAALLLKRIDLNAKIVHLLDCGDLAPFLFSSAACGQEHFVRLLLEKGCDPLSQVLLQNRVHFNDELYAEPAFEKLDNPLKQAVANGHTNVVSMLLHSINTQNHSQLGPSIMEVISIASERNEPQMLQSMLNSELSRQLDAATLKTCLSEALFLAASNEAPTQLLLDHGANPDREGDSGFHILTKAVRYGTTATVRKLLNATRLSPLWWDRNSERDSHNLLDVAQQYQNLDMIKLFLEETENVDFSPLNEDCQHVLSNAVHDKQVEIVKYFLDHGFDANGRTVRWYKNRPLLAAASQWTKSCESDPDPVVVLLLDRGAAVDIMDDSGRTALWYAVKGSNTATVQTLLDHGSDPFHDCEGQSPLHVAAKNHNPTQLRSILRSIEAKKIKHDFAGFLPKERYVPEQQEDKHLKYLTQHHYRMMYPCP